MAVGRGSEKNIRPTQSAGKFHRRVDDHWQSRVVEHELDMDRMDHRSSLLSWLIAITRRLMGLDHGIVKPPRRAVERENEEAWPSRE